MSPGETVTCTFENTKLAQLTIVKDAQPNDPQDFSFTAGGGLSPPPSRSTTTPTQRCPTQRTFTAVSPGGYSVTEGSLTGWDMTGASCDDGSPLSAIDLSPGENVTCTFTNRKQGNLIVVQDATPNDPQDFTFTAGGGLSPSSFQLDDDSDGTLSNTRTFANVSAGSYSLGQTLPSGWDQASATCDDGSTPGAIDVAAGETVTCTFTNTKQGSIVAVKDAQPNDAAGLLLHRRRRPLAVELRARRRLRRHALEHPHLRERLRRHRLLARRDRALRLGPDRRQLQRRQPALEHRPRAGRDRHLHLHEPQARRDRGREGRASQRPQDFSFTAGGGLSPTSFELDDDSDPTLSNTHTFANVVPGSGYSLAETVPGGWDQTGATCSDGSAPANIARERG